jgi:hypothetical protein
MSGAPKKGGFWRYWNTLKAAGAQKGASGYAKQTVVGIIMQALVDKKVVEHKSVVLWRAKKAQVVSAFDQIRLEMSFGSMVFTPVRTESKPPPGTDRQGAELGSLRPLSGPIVPPALR